MRYTVKNLGPITFADLQMGDMTIVCGRNNTGKSYLTYSLFSLLSFARNDIFVSPDDSESRTLYKTGKVVIDLIALAEKYNDRFSNGNMQRLMDALPESLAVNKSVITSAEFKLEVDTEMMRDTILDLEFDGKQFWRVTDNCRIYLKKIKGHPSVECRLFVDEISPSNSSSLLMEEEGKETPPQKDVIIRNFGLLISFLINHSVQDTFIITCERTGVSIFGDELRIIRSMVFEDDKNLARLRELRKRFEFKGYPLPIRKDLDFSLKYGEISSQDGFIALNHPEIIDALNSVVGGQYSFSKDTNSVKFKPSIHDVSLSLVESSSSVRSLSEITFYLKHRSRKGDLLIVDEPELNLHPDAQRKMARIFAMLVNVGIKVFITTHSDYILRELNALIMLNNLEKEKKGKLFKKHGYSDACMIGRDQVKCYVLADGKTIPMMPDARLGFPVQSFDDTIEQFNALYNDITDDDQEL